MQLLKLQIGFTILFQLVRNNSRSFRKSFIFEDQPVSVLVPLRNRIRGNSFF